MHQRSKKHALLVVAERLPPDEGGVSRIAARLSRTLARLGIEIHVLAWTKLISAGSLQTIEDLDHDGAPTGVIIHRVGLFSNWDFSLQHPLNLLEQLRREHAFSACWGHYLYPAGYLGVLFAETAGIPSTVNGVHRAVETIDSFAQSRQRSFCSACPLVLAVATGAEFGHGCTAVFILCRTPVGSRIMQPSHSGSSRLHGA